MTEIRKLTPIELGLVQALLRRAPRIYQRLERGLDELLVCPLEDGGMGSLVFGDSRANRRMGTELAQLTFPDLDGTPLWVSLNVDEGGSLFELDVFRTDFGRTESLENYPRAEV